MLTFSVLFIGILDILYNLYLPFYRLCVITAHFGDEPFQTIDCTGTHNQSHNKQRKIYAGNTQCELKHPIVLLARNARMSVFRIIRNCGTQ